MNFGPETTIINISWSCSGWSGRAYRDTIPNLKISNAFAYFRYDSGILMAHNDWCIHQCHPALILERPNIRVAQAYCLCIDHYTSWSRFRIF